MSRQTRNSALTHETRVLYTNRALTVILVSAVCFITLSGLCLAGSTPQATTQKSLLDGATTDRRLIAQLVLGDFGWIVMGSASIIAAVEFFQKKDAWILGYLSFGYILFFTLGKYFSH